MANNLQKLIYNLSAVSPLCLIFGGLWLYEKHTLTIPIICACLAGILFLGFKFFLWYAERNVAPIKIQVTTLSQKDGPIIVYIISYMIPFGSMAIEDINIIFFGIIFIISTAIILFVNSTLPNPLLLISRYKLYEISTENGVSGYLLISKRNLRNIKHIKTVRRVFEFLLIDTEG